jgi:hypothetical protein
MNYSVTRENGTDGAPNTKAAEAASGALYKSNVRQCLARTVNWVNRTRNITSKIKSGGVK